MTKIKGGLVTLSGQLGDDVFVNSQKYGKHIRKPPKPGRRKQEPAFKKQYNRTAMLNELASDINRLVHEYAGEMKSHGFYHDVLKRLRREPKDNRYLLLRQLKGLDANQRYLFNNLGSCEAVVKAVKSNIAVRLQISSHPPRGQYRANSYYYEVALLRWTKSSEKAIHSMHKSDWIAIEGKMPSFSFLFPKGATAQWLLCLRIRLCIGKKEVESFAGEAMQIVDVGTFDKKDEELLKKKFEEEEAKGKKKKEVEEVGERVKADRES